MQIAELSPSYLADIGRPTGAYPKADGSLVAVASDFLAPFWAGRAELNFLHRRRRVSLYRADWAQRLGVLDNLRFPINEIAFHPDRPLCAIATGCYDGGYLFEGELWLWDWESGQAWTVLSESRDVVGAKFGPTGELELRLRPRDEEEYPEAAFETRLLGVLSDWRHYQELGLKWMEDDPRLEHFVASLLAEPANRDWREILPVHFQPRYRVLDVAWQGQHILATQATCRLECWGPRPFQCPGQGQGLQLLSGPQGQLLHLLKDRRSQLLDLVGQELVCRHQFDSGYLFSIDRHGRILARHTEQDNRSDLLIDGQPVELKRLGHFDCFNHALRLDGGEQLYFLRGTPASSHLRKVLCRLDSQGQAKKCLSWETTDPHLMENRACFLEDGSLLRAYKIYTPGIQQGGTIDCLEMPSGGQRWRTDLPASVTCLAGTVYGLANGRLGRLDPATGQKLWEQRLTVDGVTSIPLCLQLQGDALACGTHDGRVLQIRPG